VIGVGAMNKEVEQIIKKNQYKSDFYKVFKKPHPNRSTVKQVPSFKTNNPIKPTNLKTSMSWVMKLYYQSLIAIFVLVLGLVIKKDPQLEEVNQLVFSPLNIKKIDFFVMDTLGGVFPQPKKKDLSVSLPVIDMTTSETYKNGVLVTTKLFEGVTSQIEGIVIEIKTDHDLGKIISIQNVEGQIYEYGRLDDLKISLYTRVNQGDILGMAKTNNGYEGGKFYLAIYDDGHYLDVVNVIDYEG
jgi:hypothetical protein